MRWLFSLLLLALLGAVQALSYTGGRLLVVLEEQSEREKYSVFLEDLAGKLHILLSGGIVLFGASEEPARILEPRQERAKRCLW